MSNCFTLTFIAEPEHIDDMGHVNNAVWVQWMEAVATAHWKASAAPQHLQAYAWVVTRHEIDYRGNVALGESVMAQTMLPDGPKGARFERCVDFRNAIGKTIVSARSTWAMIERASGRVVRIPNEVAAPFLP